MKESVSRVHKLNKFQIGLDDFEFLFEKLKKHFKEDFQCWLTIYLRNNKEVEFENFLELREYADLPDTLEDLQLFLFDDTDNQLTVRVSPGDLPTVTMRALAPSWCAALMAEINDFFDDRPQQKLWLWRLVAIVWNFAVIAFFLSFFYYQIIPFNYALLSFVTMATIVFLSILFSSYLFGKISYSCVVIRQKTAEIKRNDQLMLLFTILGVVIAALALVVAIFKK